MSCLLENHYDTTTIGVITTDVVPTTVQPITAPTDEDTNYCINEPNGLYRHPVCTKYYECTGQNTVIKDCPGGLYFSALYLY